MNTNEVLNKLIAEIERLKKDNGKDGRPSYVAEMLYSHFLSLIKSLQQEQPEVDEDFFFAEVLKVYDNNNKYPPRSEEELTMLETVARHFYDLGCRHAAAMYDDIEFERQRRSEEEPTIKGWVARDEDGALYVFASRPQRAKGIYKEDIWDNGDAALPLPKSIFPDLKWEDEPIEVELEIHRV